ncbi:MAG: hypothetical protein AB8B72_11010 [Crocinitomicaceae bacterium]
MTSSVLEIKEKISTWNELRNTPAALPMLTAGFGFKIQYSEYQNWYNPEDPNSETPHDIRCYFGVEELGMRFYIIDNLHDHEGQHNPGVNLFEKSFVRVLESPSIPGEGPFNLNKLVSNQISSQKCGERVLNWILSAGSWLEYQLGQLPNSAIPAELDDIGIPRVVTIPFTDLSVLFGNSQEDVYVMLALKDYGGNNGYNLELILSHVQDIESPSPVVNSFHDVTQPHPPFTLAANLHFSLLS